MEMDWRNPLDEFTLRFLVGQLTNDRERYIQMAKELKDVKGLDENAGEAFMTRAEECGRIIQQLRRQLEKTVSLPPPESSSPSIPLPRKRNHPW